MFQYSALRPFLIISTGLVLLIAVGCSSESPLAPAGTKKIPPVVPEAAPAISPSVANGVTARTGEEEHPHKPGSHGGIIIPIGSDSYHAEAVIEKGGDFRLLMLGKDETRIQEIDVQPVKAYIRAVGDPDATPVDLAAVPQDGDGPDKTSQFVGQLPESLRGRQLDVTIPNIRIAGERFRVGFTTVTESHEEAMPPNLPDDEERTLYLTPGGKYTESDIKANGNMTATQKFKGIASSHDMFPKEGDRICPITKTRANPDFTWILDGKPYQFCCPPCVDEFVRFAKEHPDEIKNPDTYIKENKSSKDDGTKPGTL